MKLYSRRRINNFQPDAAHRWVDGRKAIGRWRCGLLGASVVLLAEQEMGSGSDAAAGVTKGCAGRHLARVRHLTSQHVPLPPNLPHPCSHVGGRVLCLGRKLRAVGHAIAHEAAGSSRGHGASFLSNYGFEIPEPPNVKQPRRKIASHGSQGNKYRTNLEGFFRPIGHPTELSDKFTVYRAGSQSAPEVHDFANLPPLPRKSTPGTGDKQKRVPSIRSCLATIEPMLPTPRIV